MFDARVRRVALAVLGMISAIVLVYVVTAHVFAYQHRMSVSTRDYREGFATHDSLPDGFTLRKRGGLDVTVKGGIVHVTGAAHAGDEAVIVGPERRFDDCVISLKFRAPPIDGLEVFVGIEQSTVASSAVAAYVLGPQPMVTIAGEMSGPYRTRATNDQWKVDAAADDWRLLAFQFAPRYTWASALVDGAPVASAPVWWPQGVAGRMILGVRARGDVPNANVEIDSLSLRTLDDSMPSFHEDFKGQLLDPQRWVAIYPEPDFATLDLGVSKAGTLRLDTKVLSVPNEQTPIYFIRTIPFPLRTMHIMIDVTIEELKDGRWYAGLMGSSAWAPMDRVFDVGITNRKGVNTIDAAGAWTATGTMSFDVGTVVELPRRMRIEMSYDAHSSTGEAKVDGQLLGRHVLDLKPLDPVSLRLGAGGFAVGATSKVVVHQVEVEMR